MSESSKTDAGESTTAVKNFKNLTINVDSDNTCKCATYFNMDVPIDHVPTCDNSPTTVISSNSSVYGTHYPNRIFVGHLPGKATATDIADFFRTFGTVLEGKVVLDSFGRSRRFGFVTFSSHDDVQKVLKQENVFFKGKKINVGPAVKKMFGTEITPPASPMEEHKTENVQNNIESEGTDAIITVPPVNEKKEEFNAVAKHGNVWLKVNSKPKYASKKTHELKLQASPVIYTQQPIPLSPSYVYPTYYTVPVTTPYNYTQYYFTPQSPMSPVTSMYPTTQCTQQVMNYQQWSQLNGYGTQLVV